MWLLENEKAFQGRSLWLRPGKTYLFGRTAAEPGQLAISHNTISRKHLTITVDNVQEGHAEHLSSRSRLTIEDLATKMGTVVDGRQVKGAKHVVGTQHVDMTMGKCPDKFRIRWFPVVLTFSFTSKELQTQPLASLRERFEKLDIKLSTDYNVDHTTHVVSKKRNTAKGLQALINAQHVVAESFLDAIEQAAAPHGHGAEPSALERDFARCWPDAMQHLPPRGGEPVRHPDSMYAPDRRRKDVFDGYTFIFYDKTQYSNLLAPVANGCGKAMLHTIAPGEEQADDFVRYVKEVAGEKGLGCFDDGSEGKGVVLVRYLPAKGDLVTWYTDFITAVSLRLDHRPIEQNEFLEAILIKDASTLRRPLQVESSAPAAAQPAPESGSRSGSPNANEETHPDSQPGDEQGQQRHPTGPRRSRPRRPAKRRFAGFDDGDDDVDMDDAAPAEPARPERAAPQGEDEGGLFVSQEPDTSEPPRKRRASRLPEDDLMDGMAPAAARFKRQRLQHGDAFASPSPEPAPAPAPLLKAQPRGKKPREMDVLALAARHREQEEARARAEEEDLANLPDNVDLAEIRRLHIVEEMEVRRAPGPRTRELDVADGRWDPRWNGVKNFKRFRRRGEPARRQPARVIVPLAPVKIKEFGVGDNYWLEDQAAQTPPAKAAPASRSPPPVQEARRPPTRSTRSVLSDDDGAGAGRRDTGSSLGTRTSAAPSQRGAAASQGRGKRPAPEPAPEPRTKRPRRAPRAEAGGSDDSDDELKFRFGRRR